MPMAGRGCSVLDGIADLFGDVFSEVYDPAMLIKFIRTDALNGDITRVAFGHDCFHHPISGNQRYRAEAGLADRELEVIILASQLEGVPVETDDELVSDSKSYTVVRAKLDGAKSQWRAVCAEKK